MVADSYWLEEPGPTFRGRPSVDRADVAVVGAGVTGCSAALTLARAGRRVRVYDARAVAGGASGRNGGFASRGGAMPYERAREYLGAENARRYWELTERYLAELGRLAGDALRYVGSLQLAVDEEDRVELLAEYHALREDGFAAEWREQLGPPLERRFTAAIFHPAAASVQPARMTRRLAQRAAEAGAEIVEHHRVRSVDDLDAEQVIVATDGYPSGLLGPLEGLIVPTRGQMIATEPLSTMLFRCLHYGRHGFDYWQQLDDGRIVAGGFRDTDLSTEFTDDEVTTPPIQTALENFVAALAGRRLAIAQRWAGIFGLVLDFMPVVGLVPGSDRVWIAGGYSGHGNVLGFMCGDLAARAVNGERTPILDLFEPQRLLVRTG